MPVTVIQLQLAPQNPPQPTSKGATVDVQAFQEKSKKRAADVERELKRQKEHIQRNVSMVPLTGPSVPCCTFGSTPKQIVYLPHTFSKSIGYMFPCLF